MSESMLLFKEEVGLVGLIIGLSEVSSMEAM